MRNKLPISLKPNKQKIGVRKNFRNPIVDNENINQLILKLNEDNDQQIRVQSQKFNNGKKKPRKSSAQQKLYIENAVAVRKAQKQLNDRMKQRKINKAKRSKTDFGESYPLLYERFKTEIDEKKLYQLPEYEDLKKTKECIICYEQFEDKPTIIHYIHEKMKKRQEKIERQQEQKEKSLDILQFLKMKKKFRSQLVLNTQNNSVGKWQQQAYDREMENIDKISQNIRKIFYRGKRKELEDKAKEMLAQSPILKKQELILQRINSKNEDSKEIKEFLVGKFTGILKEIAKSMPSKRTRQNELLSERLQSSFRIKGKEKSRRGFQLRSLSERKSPEY